MTNVIIIRGRLCADPDFRQTQNGKAVCRFRLAVERNQKAENGQKQADFIPCVCWNQLAEFVSRYFRKGSMAIVEGRIQNADYTDSNGVKHYAMEACAHSVDFGESKKAADASQNAAQGNFNENPQNYPTEHTKCLQRAANGLLQSWIWRTD